MPILEGSNLEHQEICYVQKLNRVFKFGEYLNFNLNALHSLNLYWTDPNFGGLKVKSCVQVLDHQPFNICTASVQLYENSSFPPFFYISFSQVKTIGILFPIALPIEISTKFLICQELECLSIIFESDSTAVWSF